MTVVNSADKVFKSAEVVLSDALSHCKDWLKVMTGVTEAAEIMQVVAEKALGSSTHAKAFVNLIGMTNKESDLYSAVKALFDTIQSYAKLAKSSSIAQQVLEYVFGNVEAYGGKEKLEMYLQQLEADKDRLIIQFPVGSPGAIDSVVELFVEKKARTSRYSVKRVEMLSSVIDLMATYVEDSGRKYKEAVTSIQALNQFLQLVNSYATLKKPEDRDRVEQQLMQNPLWDRFQGLISFPAEKESFTYDLQVTDPETKVVSFMLQAARVVRAFLNDPIEALISVDSTLETLVLGVSSVVSFVVEEIAEAEDVVVTEEDEFGELALAASFKQKALDLGSEISTEEILRARKVLEDAGISEEIIFLLPSVDEVRQLNQVVANKKVVLAQELIQGYADYFDATAKEGKSIVPIKTALISDVRSIGVSASKVKVLSDMPVNSIYAEVLTPNKFLVQFLGLKPYHSAKSSRKVKSVEGEDSRDYSGKGVGGSVDFPEERKKSLIEAIYAVIAQTNFESEGLHTLRTFLDEVAQTDFESEGPHTLRTFLDDLDVEYNISLDLGSLSINFEVWVGDDFVGDAFTIKGV